MAVSSCFTKTFVYFNICRSSDDGTCRIWDVRFPEFSPWVYMPKPLDAVAGLFCFFYVVLLWLSWNFVICTHLRTLKFAAGKSTGASSNGLSSIDGPQSHQILCCAYNANGTVFVTGSSDTYARVHPNIWTWTNFNVYLFTFSTLFILNI